MTERPRSTTILIVDDDTMSRDLLAVLLAREGFRVECCASGDAALVLLDASTVPPEVVLTDIQMPGITGAELAAALRNRCGEATVLLAMSGSGPSSAATASFDAFLLKPFPIGEVATAIARCSSLRAATASTPAAVTASKNNMSTDVLERSVQQPDFAEPAAHPVPRGAGDAPALNETIYSQLAASMTAVQLRQMYGMCLDDARERIVAMRRLVVEGDAMQFTREAHSIKGGCGMLGASELFSLAAGLESRGLGAVDATGTQGVNPLDELVSACDRLERILASRA